MKNMTTLAALALSSVVALGQPASFSSKAPHLPEYLQPALVSIKSWNSVSSQLSSGSLRNVLSTPSRAKFRTSRSAQPLQAAPKVASADPMISQQPEGQVKYYTRFGTCYDTMDGLTHSAFDQEGMMTAVYAPDGKTVYFSGLVSAAIGANSWVKGELSADGKTITVPLYQKSIWLEGDGCHLVLAMLNYNEAKGTFFWDKQTSKVTLTVEGDRIRLNDTNANRILGLIFENDNAWCFWGDFETEFDRFGAQTVTAPADAAAREYIFSATDDSKKRISKRVEMRESGNEVYLKGLCNKSAPQSWIKGDRSGNQLSFSKNQFMGVLNNYHTIYFSGATIDAATGYPEASSFVLDYDEASKSYSSKNWIFEVADTTQFGYIAYYRDVTLRALPDVAINYDVIREQPKGEKKTYNREGSSYLNYLDEVRYREQKGSTIDIVYAADGKTVYLKDPVCMASYSTWVKGTLNGSKITVPLFQSVNVSADNKSYFLACLTTTAEGLDRRDYKADLSVSEVTYTVDAEGNLSLDLPKDGLSILGLVDSHLFEWTGYGDYASAYRLVQEKVTTIPQGLAAENWILNYRLENNKKSAMVRVAVDNDKVYIDHLPKAAPESAVVGTIKDGKVVFVSDQYLGIQPEKQNPLYFGGAKYDVVNHEYPGWTWSEYSYNYTDSLVFNYDAATKQLTPAADSTAFIVNWGKLSEARRTVLAGCEPAFSAYVNKGLQPASPSFVNYEDCYDFDGYVYVSLKIPTTDVEGNYIYPGDMAYKILLYRNGEVSTYTFTKDKYTKLEKDLTVIPYNFADNNSIGVGGSLLFIREGGIEDMAVVSINRANGKEICSDPVWNFGIATGVKPAVSEGAKVVSVKYYTLSGTEVAVPSKGIYIKCVTYADGSRKTEKVLHN